MLKKMKKKQFEHVITDIPFLKIELKLVKWKKKTENRNTIHIYDEE